jgi:hypothetical protein
MIVSFSVSNFRSFSSEETLSLVASNRLSGHHDDHAVPIPDSKEKVLRTAVIYGANGAGKSNLFKALRYVEMMVLQPRQKKRWTGREVFRFGEAGDAPSGFDLQFIAQGKLYRFGFKVNDRRITEEWLVRVNWGRETTIYERATDENGKVTIEGRGLKTGGEKLMALATVGGPQNQLFLATMRATVDASDLNDELRGILTWFEGGLILIAPDAPLGSLGHVLAADSDLQRFASEFLKSASTGVDHLEVLKNEISEDDLRRLLPEAVVSDALEKIGQSEEGRALVIKGEGEDLLVERTADNHFYRIAIQAAHEHRDGKPVPLDLAEESDGTQRLLELIPALHDLRVGDATYIVDEIDRSMHPMLVWKFLEFFLKSCSAGRGQLIVTTHESNLLDLDLLRRDEIWFAEKDQSGATRLYSMIDFKVRKDLEIRKHYLQGRFGAVPFLGNIDRLLEADS